MTSVNMEKPTSLDSQEKKISDWCGETAREFCNVVPDEGTANFSILREGEATEASVASRTVFVKGIRLLHALREVCQIDNNVVGLQFGLGVVEVDGQQSVALLAQYEDKNKDSQDKEAMTRSARILDPANGTAEYFEDLKTLRRLTPDATPKTAQ